MSVAFNALSNEGYQNSTAWATITITPTKLPCVILAVFCADDDTAISSVLYDGNAMTQESIHTFAISDLMAVYSYVPSTVGAAKNITAAGTGGRSRWRGSSAICYSGVDDPWKYGSWTQAYANSSSVSVAICSSPPSSHLHVNAAAGWNMSGFTTPSHTSRLSGNWTAWQEAAPGTTGNFTWVPGASEEWTAFSIPILAKPVGGGAMWWS